MVRVHYVTKEGLGKKQYQAEVAVLTKPMKVQPLARLAKQLGLTHRVVGYYYTPAGSVKYFEKLFKFGEKVTFEMSKSAVKSWMRSLGAIQPFNDYELEKVGD